jgi:hypothetical protein
MNRLCVGLALSLRTNFKKKLEEKDIRDDLKAILSGILYL